MLVGAGAEVVMCSDLPGKNSTKVVLGWLAMAVEKALALALGAGVNMFESQQQHNVKMVRSRLEVERREQNARKSRRK